MLLHDPAAAAVDGWRRRKSEEEQLSGFKKSLLGVEQRSERKRTPPEDAEEKR